jgi:glyoxylase-like metal-dependent hydrolase (beta-lactamase superfamily II)
MSFAVQNLKDGLWRWTAPHPEWQPEKGGPGGWEQQVGCVYYETSGATVLIDPLAPAYGTPEAEIFWRHLDEDIARAKARIVVLVSNRYHGRSAAAVRDRYQGRRPVEIWAHEAAKDHLKVPVSHWFADGHGLPAGVRAIPLTTFGPDEVAFYLPEHKALVVADAILGAGKGALRLAPKSWAPLDEKSQEQYASWFRSEIRSLLDLPIEMVLVSHGEPVLTNGRAALVDALANPAWGQ